MFPQSRARLFETDPYATPESDFNEQKSLTNDAREVFFYPLQSH